MKKYAISPRLSLILHGVLGLVFLLSGWTKAGHPSLLANHLRYEILWFPAPLAWPFTIFLAVIEIAVGVMLLTRLRVNFARKITAVLLTAFTLYLLINLLLGQRSPCQCYGALVTLHPLLTMALDIILLGLVLFLERATNPQAGNILSGCTVAVCMLALVFWTRNTAHFDAYLLKLQPGMAVPVLPSLHPLAINRERPRVVMIAEKPPNPAALETLHSQFPGHELVLLQHGPSTENTPRHVLTMAIKPELVAYFAKSFPTSFTLDKDRVQDVWFGSLPEQR